VSRAIGANSSKSGRYAKSLPFWDWWGAFCWVLALTDCRKGNVQFFKVNENVLPEAADPYSLPDAIFALVVSIAGTA
jgi:hypothetical protein